MRTQYYTYSCEHSEEIGYWRPNPIKCKCDLEFCSQQCFDRHECSAHKPTEKECEGCGEWDETVVEGKENGIPFRVCRSCYTDETHNQSQKWGER